MKKTCIILLMLTQCIGCFYGYGQTDHAPPLRLKDTPEGLIAAIGTSIPELMTKGKVPGLQVAVIRDGEMIWTKGFGVKNTENGEKVNSNTIFEAASLTKPLFAYAVLQIVEEKKLELDTPLLKYLNNSEIESFFGHPLDTEGFHREWAEKITARQVLSHAAGMPHGEGGDVYPILFEPGTQYKYSAAGYELLQRVIEKIKGQPLDVLIEKYVLDPLRMNQSAMVWKDLYTTQAANGHDLFGKPQAFRQYTAPHAAASLYTTASDYSRFVCAVLNSQGLTPETYKEMLSPQITVNKELGLNWSLGFGTQKDTNGKGIWQWGDYGIFRNYILAYPDHKLAVVYVTNSFNGLGICKEIIKKTIGGQATGITFLEYTQYDTPLAQFCWAVIDKGAEVVKMQLPKLRVQHPNVFTEESIGWLGEQFSQAGKFDESIALLKSNVDNNPSSPNAHMQLARAYLENGDKEHAIRYYNKTVELAKSHQDFDTAQVTWAIEYIKALQHPAEVSQNYLEIAAGSYGPRNIELRNNELYYARNNPNGLQYRKLIPLGKDIFIMEELIDFRLKFEFDAEGKAIKIIGLYESGYRDESVRNKE